MNEDVYLQIILLLKSTFDILLLCKINFQHNWIGIYECLQNIIHSKCHLIIVTNDINNMNIKIKMSYRSAMKGSGGL
jgi:hypothetical protein